MIKYLRFLYLALAVFAVSYAGHAQTNATNDWVYLDVEGDGSAVFQPEKLINPVITGAVAALLAALGIFVLYRGSRWIMRVFSTTK